MAAVGSYVPERCHSAANLTPSDVVEFITTGQKPANCETVLCSTLLLLECGLRDQGMSVNEHLPGLVHAIDSAVELPTYCSNVLKKIWKKAEECGQEDLDNLLASPVSSVYKPKKKEDPNKVGEECAKAGITRHVLDKGWDNPPEIVVTKMVVAEIEGYCQPETDDDRWWLALVTAKRTTRVRFPVVTCSPLSVFTVAPDVGPVSTGTEDECGSSRDVGLGRFEDES
ncbi:hypothetical protein Bbelb_016260 [Branchiostoma belcheri]|nr:hypothetical protein Bbelb_016260 [Branchiostoma belcheri]